MNKHHYGPPVKMPMPPKPKGAKMPHPRQHAAMKKAKRS